MGELTLERYDKDCHRIMRGDVVVALVNRHCDDLWSISDLRDHRLTKRRFRTPKRALAFAHEELLDRLTPHSTGGR